jgi:UDP-2,3-diacylglucosamine hydrolase
VSLVYFVSDLHIRSDKDEKAQIFLRFLHLLEKKPTPVTLVLGGDIFDLWLGDHTYFQKKFKGIVDQIRKLVELKHSIYYFEGNHDIHLQKFWQDQVGVTVYTEPEFLLFDDLVVRFEHGDQMDPDDHGYHFLRWLLRTWFFRWLIFSLPDAVVVKLGQSASQMSRSYTDRLRDETRIRNVMHDHAERIYNKRPFDAIVHGHVHLRDEYLFEAEQKKVASFNLGSWDQEYPVLVLDKGKWFWEFLK